MSGVGFPDGVTSLTEHMGDLPRYSNGPEPRVPVIAIGKDGTVTAGVLDDDLYRSGSSFEVANNGVRHIYSADDKPVMFAQIFESPACVPLNECVARAVENYATRIDSANLSEYTRQSFVRVANFLRNNGDV